ncbi:hypothetical protein [Mucilaginibacter agri]|nr:hypothetical protein [Mucilaginibacter agri]
MSSGIIEAHLDQTFCKADAMLVMFFYYDKFNPVEMQWKINSV